MHHFSHLSEKCIIVKKKKIVNRPGSIDSSVNYSNKKKKVKDRIVIFSHIF